MFTDGSTQPRGGDGVVDTGGKRLSEAISPVDKSSGAIRKKPSFGDHICTSCKQLFKADSARGKKCQVC